MKLSLQMILKLTISLITLLSTPISFAQSYCKTPPVTKNIKENNDLKQMHVNANHYCIRVYFHVVLTDGPGNQTPSTVAQAYQILNDDFAPHNISF